VIASFDSYAEAQRALATLADRQFPVEHASIIGRDVRLVDRVMGHVSAGKAALAGFATGVWIGLMVGLIFAIVSPWAIGAISFGVLLGGALGALWGLLAHALLGGNRVIESLRTIEAASYELVVDQPFAEQATHLLKESPEATTSRVPRGVRPMEVRPADGPHAGTA
jgi:hypothetical protein